MPPVQGPVLELWKVAVRKKDIPPLQGGEHMTIGQVGKQVSTSAAVNQPHTHITEHM
jgi:hypothetical protein